VLGAILFEIPYFSGIVLPVLVLFSPFSFLFSEFSYWPYRLTVRTEASQALNRGSIPRRVTDWDFGLPKSEDSLKTRDSFGVPLSIS
jgi:hypothetical protein